MNLRLSPIHTEKGLYQHFIAFIFLTLVVVSVLYVLTGKVTF